VRFHLNEECRDHRILLFFFARDARFRSIVNVIMTVVAMLLVDRLGRKPLLYIGAALLRPGFMPASACWPCSSRSVRSPKPKGALWKKQRPRGSEAGTPVFSLENPAPKRRAASIRAATVRERSIGCMGSRFPPRLRSQLLSGRDTGCFPENERARSGGRPGVRRTSDSNSLSSCIWRQGCDSIAAVSVCLSRRRRNA
jgi:hypothetical protein